MQAVALGNSCNLSDWLQRDEPPAYPSDSPERLLMREIIEQAIEDLRSKNQRVRHSAERWFDRGTLAPGYVTSDFWLVCQILSLDPAAVKKAIFDHAE